jgi:hypothetical protein
MPSETRWAKLLVRWWAMAWATRWVMALSDADAAAVGVDREVRPRPTRSGGEGGGQAREVVLRAAKAGAAGLHATEADAAARGAEQRQPVGGTADQGDGQNRHRVPLPRDHRVAAPLGQERTRLAGVVAVDARHHGARSIAGVEIDVQRRRAAAAVGRRRERLSWPVVSLCTWLNIALLPRSRVAARGAGVLVGVALREAVGEGVACACERAGQCALMQWNALGRLEQTRIVPPAAGQQPAPAQGRRERWSACGQHSQCFSLIGRIRGTACPAARTPRSGSGHVSAITQVAPPRSTGRKICAHTARSRPHCHVRRH